MRALITASCVCLAISAVGGCTTQRYWGGSERTGGTAKIGIVTKTETNPYFVDLREAARKRAAAKGADFAALAGKFDGDNDGQVTAIENLVQQGVTTLLITPNSSTGVLGAIEKARQQGVLVIALDTATEPADAVDATFATDNFAAGREQGSYLKAAIGSTPAKILMLDGTPGSTVDTQRHGGFLQGMGIADNSPDILGRQAVNGDQNKAQQAMENLLQRATNVNMVYTMNEPTAMGAYAAMSARGVANKVITGSIDGGCSGVKAVQQGHVAATVMQFPRKMAELAVDAAVEYAKTKKKPTGFQDTGSVVITDKPVPGVASKDTKYGLQNCWGSK